MGAGLLVLQLSLVSCMTIFLLNKYAQLRKQRLLVLVSTFFGWFFSFLIIIVLPLDVSITFYKKCLLLDGTNGVPSGSNVARTTLEAGEDTHFEGNESSFLCEEPNGFVQDNVLLGLWRVVYWSSQFLTWVLLPMMQSYAKAGEFTVKGRLKYAFYANAVYYGLYLTAFTLLLVYAISKGVHLNFDALKVLVVTAANTWGLFLLVILLGYGLIEVPRQCWRMGIKGYRLQRAYFDIDKLSSERNEAEETLREVYNETKNALNLLKSASGPSRDKLRQIVLRFPGDFVKNLKEANSKNVGKEGSWTPAPNFMHLDADTVNSDVYLTKLNRRVINAAQNYHRCQTQWNSLLELAFYLEDVEVAESTGQLPAQWTTLSADVPGRRAKSRPFYEPVPLYAKARFLWHVTMRRPIMKCLAVFFASMTAMILWSECTFFVVDPQLSIAARILHRAAKGYHYKYIQVYAIGMILYLCTATYYTIFRLRIYRYYRLDPNQVTDENSLIFSAMLICRLTAPMCLNFLGMIHLDSHVTENSKFGIETQFTRLMGHLDIIPLVAKGINIYLPIVILILCMATYFNLGSHFLNSLGIDQFLEEDDMTREMMQGGKALVSLERGRIARARGREERNEAWKAERLGTLGMGSRMAAGRGEEDRRPILEEEEERGDWQGQITRFSTGVDLEANRRGAVAGGDESQQSTQMAVSPQSIFDDV